MNKNVKNMTGILNCCALEINLSINIGLKIRAKAQYDDYTSPPDKSEGYCLYVYKFN